MSDHNATDERPRYSWARIHELISSGIRGNLLDAINDARRHLVWFARERGVRVGYDQDGCHWSLPSAIRKLARDGIITTSQELDLLRVVDIRDDEIHNDPPPDEELIWATNIIATVCGAENHTHTGRSQSLSKIVSSPTIQQRERSKAIFTEQDYITETRRKFYEAKSLLDSMNPLDNLISWGKQKFQVGILANELYKLEHPEKYEQEQREQQKEREAAAVLREQKRQVEEAQKRAREKEDAARRAVMIQRKEQQERTRQRWMSAVLALTVLSVLTAGMVAISQKDRMENVHVGTERKMVDTPDADTVHDSALNFTSDTLQRHEDNVEQGQHAAVSDIAGRIYLKKGAELQFRAGDDPSKLLAARILEHCAPVPNATMKAAVAADGTELACTNHHLPKKIRPGMKLRSPRDFICPSSSSIRKVKSVRAEFCAGLK